MDRYGLIPFFEDLHAHPELSGAEHRTTGKLLEALRAAGIDVLDAGLPTGAIARIGGKRPGCVIGLRADIDALPIREETELPYRSRNEGVMHACGHDFHAAAMLGAALALKEREDGLDGTVKIVFQPAEETASGAKRMLATGLLDDCEEFYAIHSYPWFPAGTLGIKEGPVMAAPDRFRIAVRGRGAHGAEPNTGIDPIPAAAAIVLAAQHIVSRRMDPFRAAVVSVTHMEAGNTWNVIPEAAMLEGTVRTLHAEDRDMAREALRETAERTAAAYGCTAAFDWREGPAPVVNDAGLCADAKALAEEMGFTVDRQKGTMGGEDFSEYLNGRPGVFVRVGTGGYVVSHHPKFTVDERALVPAAEFFAALAMRRVKRQGQGEIRNSDFGIRN